ncbi:hypothetical protein B484DRAFT_409998, partial [Ochromonadaceae sp. CCMP2298]
MVLDGGGHITPVNSGPWRVPDTVAVTLPHRRVGESPALSGAETHPLPLPSYNPGRNGPEHPDPYDHVPNPGFPDRPVPVEGRAGAGAEQAPIQKQHLEGQRYEAPERGIRVPQKRGHRGPRVWQAPAEIAMDSAGDNTPPLAGDTDWDMDPAYTGAPGTWDQDLGYTGGTHALGDADARVYDRAGSYSGHRWGRTSGTVTHADPPPPVDYDPRGIIAALLQAGHAAHLASGSSLPFDALAALTAPKNIAAAYTTAPISRAAGGTYHPVSIPCATNALARDDWEDTSHGTPHAPGGTPRAGQAIPDFGSMSDAQLSSYRAGHPVLTLVSDSSRHIGGITQSERILALRGTGHPPNLVLEALFREIRFREPPTPQQEELTSLCQLQAHYLWATDLSHLPMADATRLRAAHELRCEMHEYRGTGPT